MSLFETKCPVCKTNRHVVVADEYIDGQYLWHVKCHKCLRETFREDLKDAIEDFNGNTSVGEDGSEPRSFQIKLPWPPSINRYYRHWKNRMLISAAGRKYRDTVATLCLPTPEQMTGRLYVKMEAYPPDRRHRDIDNIQKAVWDSLQHAGVYKDDSQIHHMEAFKHAPVPNGGFIIVTVREIQ